MASYLVARPLALDLIHCVPETHGAGATRAGRLWCKRQALSNAVLGGLRERNSYCNNGSIRSTGGVARADFWLLASVSQL